MKQLLTSILILVFSNFLISQDFTLLSSDLPGDQNANFAMDLSALSYAIDETQDSLWFKIEFHAELFNDLGVIFGIDTDLIPDNGFL